MFRSEEAWSCEQYQEGSSRYGCDADDKTTTKQRKVEPYLQTIKVPKNNFTFKFSPETLASFNRSLT